MFKLFMKRGGWSVIFPFLLALVGLMGYLGASDDAARFDAEGVETTATVSNLRKSTRMGGSGTRSTDYYVRVSYSTGSAMDGTLKIHFAEEKVSSSFYGSLSKGDKIPVRYLASEPGEAEIEPGGTSENAMWAGIMGLIFAVLGVLLLVFILRVTRQAWRAREQGLAVEGTVDDIAKKGDFYVVSFSYTGSDGTRHEARMPPKRAKKVAGLEVGSRITVFYHPDDPKRAFWEGDVGPRERAA